MARLFKLVHFDLRDPFSFPYSPDAVPSDHSCEPCLVISTRLAHCRKSIHSRKLAAKLMQVLPSQRFLPRLLTISGMLWVLSSSSCVRIPSAVRKPTIIFGTPSKNDCIQIFKSFRSNLTWSRSLSTLAEVFNSTQLTGRFLSSGLMSQTYFSISMRTLLRAMHLTCVNLTADYHLDLAIAGADNGAVLRVIADDLVFARFDVLPRCGIPRQGQQRECFEFVAPIAHDVL
jgi:hypothetical protein